MWTTLSSWTWRRVDQLCSVLTVHMGFGHNQVQLTSIQRTVNPFMGNKKYKRCICCPYFALKHKTTHNLILTSENRLKVIVAGKLKILVILPPCSHLSSSLYTVLDIQGASRPEFLGF